MEKYMFAAMTVCAAVGFGYGLYRFFRKSSALYIRMIVLGIGCAMLGRLFQTLQLALLAPLALIYAFLCMAEIIQSAFAVPAAVPVIIYSLLCVTLIIFVPVLEKGTRSWSI